MHIEKLGLDSSYMFKNFHQSNWFIFHFADGFFGSRKKNREDGCAGGN